MSITKKVSEVSEKVESTLEKSFHALRDEVRDLKQQVSKALANRKSESTNVATTSGTDGKGAISLNNNPRWAWPGWPNTDLRENDTHFFLTVDLPGLEKDDVLLNVESNRLLLSAEQDYERKEERDGWVVRERMKGSFTRTLPLPAKVDPEHCKAKMKSGVLEVELKKAQAGRSSREIKVA